MTGHASIIYILPPSNLTVFDGSNDKLAVAWSGGTEIPAA
jgi:hypothetical protein